MKEPFKINKVLIPLDFSDTSKLALDHAVHICKKFDADLHLLHVYTSSNVEVLPNLESTGFNVNAQEIKNVITEELNKIGNDIYEKHKLGYQIEVRDGSISKEISKTATEVKADLIVMGTHGVSGFEEFFLGSNAYRTVTASTVPVLTIQGHAKSEGYGKIVMPIDSSKHSRDKVTQVVAFAKAFNAKVYIAGLITEEHEEESKVFNLKVKQVQEHFEAKGVDFETEIIHGDDIAKMTIKYSEKVGADLVIVMTEQEASTGLFMGPYAQQVVNHSKIPILSVTPLQILESFSQSQLAGDYRPFNI